MVKAQAPFKGVGGGKDGLSAFEKERLENIKCVRAGGRRLACVLVFISFIPTL